MKSLPPASRLFRGFARTRAVRATVRTSILSLLATLVAGPVGAADHRDAVIIFDSQAAAVILIPALATEQQLLWAGDPLIEPTDAILAADGSLLIADAGADAIFRFDWASGISPTPFAPLGADLCWLAMSGPSAILASGPAGLFRIDPGGGDVTQIPAALETPFDVGLLPGGDALVADPGLQELVRVDPATGASESFATGGFNCWIDVGSQGDVVAVGPDGVFVVGPGGGDLQRLTTGGLLSDPSAVAFGHHGDIYVADRGPAGGGAGTTTGPGIVKVDPGNGAQTLVASGGFLQSPSAIVVVDATQLPGLPTSGRVVLAALIVALALAAWTRHRRARAMAG